MLALTNSAPGRLVLAERPDPVPGDGQILIAVRAAGLNRADLLQRAGKYPAPPGWPADIPGLEYAGEVIATGAGVTRWTVGDRVMGLVGGGAQAERLVAHEREMIRMPRGMSFTDAAAIPEAFLTAWDALVRGRAAPGERVLIHAIGSGVGTAAAQLGRMMGLAVIGTSRTPEKLDRCRPLGMTHGVLTTDADWPTQVGGPVSLILDLLGAGVFAPNLALLAPCGRMVTISTMTGSTVAEFDLGQVLRRRLEIIGTVMRTRSPEERADLVARFQSVIVPRFEDHTLRPIVHQVFPFEEAERAYEVLAGNQAFGKVVLALPDAPPFASDPPPAATPLPRAAPAP